MPKRYRPVGLIICFALTIILSGCATNDIRVERAATMTDAARAATNATRILMADVQSENREALIDLVASDPNCRLPTPLIAQGATTDNETICREGNKQDNDFRLARLTRRDFDPSLAVIDGLVAYFDAVDAIITREPTNFEDKLLDAQSTLDAIAANLGTLSDEKDTTLLVLTDDQKAAVGDMLSLLNEIIDEVARVDDLREVEIQLDQTAFANDLDRLNRINDRWLLIMNVQIDNRLTLIESRLPRIAAEHFDQRHRYAAQQMTLIERQEALPDLKIALSKTVGMLSKTHGDYHKLLFGDERLLTLDEKRKAAAITRARMRSALSHLAAIVRVF
ncbi:hypothetical protein [Parasphingorhabdus cellanae]|uniref:Uncharacterized protein n=1 Tax=Parasphingorhabdus cellanae TaxID=2806553 RepID=A0ABX7T2W0_9SPHN|nr:hypothetical protein [Parasphingorhabdus cellanae]QTD55900.1 hypothetical protein J4G78_17230 [Parasphingorhabdus cellanae]